MLSISSFFNDKNFLSQQKLILADLIYIPRPVSFDRRAHTMALSYGGDEFAKFFIGGISDFSGFKNGGIWWIFTWLTWLIGDRKISDCLVFVSKYFLLTIKSTAKYYFLHLWRNSELRPLPQLATT